MSGEGERKALPFKSSNKVNAWRRDREMREPGMVYLLEELVPESPAAPWDMYDPQPPQDAALPIIPFTSLDVEEQGDQVRTRG